MQKSKSIPFWKIVPTPTTQKKKKEWEKEIENKKSSLQMKIDYSSDIETWNLVNFILHTQDNHIYATK